MNEQIQYIGARYVVKIYENKSNPDSAEWDENVNYEPLVMVTFNNGSYLSKKNVPATVGNPAANPIYWVQTGFYNGQILELQRRATELEEGLNSEINTRSIADTSLGNRITALTNSVNASVSNLQSADNRIEASVTAEATARENADEALSTRISTNAENISAETSARTTADAALSDRIDEIIAPSGEAPSPAEVTDARIGANGITYNTLGGAIRGQVNEIKSDIDNGCDILKNIVGVKPYVNWIDGAGIATSQSTIDITALVTNSVWKCQIIPCTAGDVFHVKINGASSTYRPWAWVAADGTKLGAAAVNSVDVDITAPENAVYLVVNVKTDVATVWEVTSGTSTIPPTDLTYMKKGGLSNFPVDFNDITDIGTYGIYKNDPSTRYVNAPFDDGGDLIVVSSISGYIKQIAISTGLKVFVRHYHETWTSWEEMCSVNEMYEFYRSNNLLGIFETIGVVGDSLSAGQGRINDLDHFHDFYNYSWPAQMKRKLGNEVYNFSKSGLSTRTWLTDNMGWALASDGDHKAQCYIIALGGNDIKLVEDDPAYVGSSSDIHVDDYTLNPDTYYGNYARIISMLRTIEPRSIIFTLPNPEYGDETIRAQLNTAVEYMSTVFDDVYFVPLDESVYKRGFINANKVKSHYTPAAYLYMANNIIANISKVIYNNPSDFFFVDLIGTNYVTPTIE